MHVAGVHGPGGIHVQAISHFDCRTDARSVRRRGQCAIGVIRPLLQFRPPRRISFDTVSDDHPAPCDQSCSASAWNSALTNPATGLPGTMEYTGRLLDEPVAEIGSRRATARSYRSAGAGAAACIAIIAANSASRRVQRRQRAARVACPVAGQRDDAERAGWRRQDFGRLHGILGTGDTHDEAGMERRLPAHVGPAWPIGEGLGANADPPTPASAAPGTQASSTTVLRSVPMPEPSTSTTSPGLSQRGGSKRAPAPVGVPVTMRSPGVSVANVER